MPFNPNDPYDNPSYTEAQRTRYAAARANDPQYAKDERTARGIILPTGKANWYNPSTWTSTSIYNALDKGPFSNYKNYDNPVGKLGGNFYNTAYNFTLQPVLKSALRYGGDYARIKQAKPGEERDATLRRGVQDSWDMAWKTGVFLRGMNTPKPTAAVADKVKFWSPGRFTNWVSGKGFEVPGVTGLARQGVRNAVAAGGIGVTADIATGGDDPRQTASSVLPGRSYTLTPEEAMVIAEANRPENRTDAAGNTGMGGRRTVGFPYPEIVIPTALPTGTPGEQPIPTIVEPAAPPAPGLLPLTPEQLASIGEERTAAEKAYEDLINMYKLQEDQGRQGYVSDVQAARRQAAGNLIDARSGLADTGMGDSPAAAFGAGQMVEGTRQAREMAGVQTLNQLLSQLTIGRTQAKSTKEATMVGINRLMNEYRLRNTLASQQDAYNNIGGL